MAPVKSSKGNGAPAGSSQNKSQKKRNVTHNPDGTVKVAVGKAKKERTYTESQLGIPKLNMITPAGVQKGKGKKKGKVFVDDQQSMMTILAMVNAEKEGQIESKLMRARQMEEIREARRKEAEARQEQKKTKLASLLRLKYYLPSSLTIYSGGNQGIAPPQKEAENF
ncbi:60S ribosomal subunit assembly/export protein loc1 [Phyllosticta citriasiana]|uniref:60S ribosomal subunit assembly/export protein loc1 n=1 Tax=Phyllosticta citriasiana TaxID=595635 RepID=A0ABR1KID5_9PEZI